MQVKVRRASPGKSGLHPQSGKTASVSGHCKLHLAVLSEESRNGLSEVLQNTTKHVYIPMDKWQIPVQL